MSLRRGNRDVIEPGFSGHKRVACRIVGGQTALVAKVDVPCWPIGWGFAQLPIRPTRRVSAGEHKMELAACPNRTISRRQNARRRCQVQRLSVLHRMPAATL